MAITINGSGTITGISAGGLPDGVITSADLASGAITAAGLPAGSILQVVSTQYDTPDTVSPPVRTHTDMPFSVNITPTTSNSLMLITYSLFGEMEDQWDTMISISRTISGTRTVIVPSVAYSTRSPGLTTFGDNHGSADNSSTPSPATVVNFPDTGRPANTNTITYAPTIYSGSNTLRTLYLNQNQNASDTISFERGISWITVMEVAA